MYFNLPVHVVEHVSRELMSDIGPARKIEMHQTGTYSKGILNMYLYF